MKEYFFKTMDIVRDKKRYLIIAIYELYFIIYWGYFLPKIREQINVRVFREIRVLISFVAIGLAVYTLRCCYKYKKDILSKKQKSWKIIIWRIIVYYCVTKMFLGVMLLLKIFRSSYLDLLYTIFLFVFLLFVIQLGIDAMNVELGTNWDILLLIVISILFISLRNDKLITALVSYGIIKLIDWLSSSDSLYYFVNPHAELSVSDLESVNFQIKRKWMIQKANALFIVICVGLTYGIREMIPGELLRSFVHSIVDWLVTIKFFTGDGDINLRKNFAESMILVVIFFMLTVLIKYIILKKKWDIPYLKAMVENQINIAKNIEKESSRKTKRNKIRSRFIKYRR